MKKILLAVVGLPGAGKTETTGYILKKTGWPRVYFGEAVLDEVKKRGLDLNEQNEKAVREELRKEHGMAAMAVINLPKIKELYKSGSVLIESLYGWEECMLIKREFGDSFKVLAIFASYPTRVSRMAVRQTRPLTEGQVNERDVSQIENLHQAGPIARSDWTIVNEASKEELHENIDKILADILN